MIRLYFGDLPATLTTAILLILLAAIGVSFARRRTIAKWGRIVLVLILVGTAASMLSAMRDAYMMEGAAFAADGAQSTICSIAGGLIFLIGILSLFIRRQPFRKAGFYAISALALVQILAIEGTRIASYLGGAV
jgi:hypothetical protein